MPEQTTRQKGKNRFSIHLPDSTALRRLLEESGFSLPGVVMRLAWQLGLQRREIHALTWEQVCFASSEVRLDDRTVPMEPEIQIFLQQLLTVRNRAEGWVVLSDRGREQPTEQHLSYVCRKALDGAGLTEVRLQDLRYDYILRQLEHHDWQQVSRISGLDPRTLRMHFAAEMGSAQKESSRPAVDAARVQAVLEREGMSACGTAIRLVWQLGLRQEEVLRLGWDQIDWKQQQVVLADRTVPIPTALVPFLLALERRNRPYSQTVLLSDRAKKPLEGAYLSRTVRAALIRGGCDNLTLRDLRRDWELRARYETPVLSYLQRHKRIVRRDLMELLGLTGEQANAGLRSMVERGTLVRSGHSYYLPGAVVAPEQQRDAILAYLSNHAGCRSGQLARLLGLEPKQCLTVVQKLLDQGDIQRVGARYYPGTR